jgi:hypothetical protein
VRVRKCPGGYATWFHAQCGAGRRGTYDACAANDRHGQHAGMHTMPATVTHTDPNTGIVDVVASGMALRVHFPQDSMANLKVGDKIGLYMAYSQAAMVH